MSHNHRWGDWFRYDHIVTRIDGSLAPLSFPKNVKRMSKLRERRQCLQCGDIQDRIVKEKTIRNDRIERIAADMWRAENPETSVFACDIQTKKKYRKRAQAEIKRNQT